MRLGRRWGDRSPYGFVSVTAAGGAGVDLSTPRERPLYLGFSQVAARGASSRCEGLRALSPYCARHEPRHRVRTADRAGLRPRRPRGLGPGGAARRAGRVSRTPAASTRRCTPAARGRCASTPASAPPSESNARYHQLIDAGTTGLSVAFDLPTQMGYDSDAPDRARRGRQGRRGHRLDRRHAGAVRRHPAGQGLDVDDDQRARRRCCCCSTSSSARSRASPATALTGTIQNDVLKEYIARGTYIFPPKPSLRLIADIFALLPGRDPEVEHDLDLRLPHGRGRRDARAGDRVHARRRHRVRPRGASRPGRTSTTSRRGCRSSSSPARRCWRRSRSSAPPGGSGRG